MKKIGIVFPIRESGGVYQLAESIFEGIQLISSFQCLKVNPPLKEEEVDLLIFPTPFSRARPGKTPFFVFIPDLMYRYYPSFPEYRFFERIKRDFIYKWFTKRAAIVGVDSEQGKEDVHRFLKIEKEKIRIIPYVPPKYIFEYQNMSREEAREILKEKQIPDQFLFYPAQLWSHKNHKNLFEALQVLKREHDLEIPLVLTSSLNRFHQEWKELKNFAKKLGIENQIIQLGYVTDKEIVALYKTAKALVFPTLIGPTSIPPLEAQVLGTPILCSNLFAMPSQLGEGALFFNPFDPKDIAQKIYQLWGNEKERAKLIQKGYENTKHLTLCHYGYQWVKIIQEFYEAKRN